MSAPNKQCVARLQRELKKLKLSVKEKKERQKTQHDGATAPGNTSNTNDTNSSEGGAPNDDIYFDASPDPRDILQWYFLFIVPEEQRPEEACYAGGRYLGKIQFPPTYPYKPPKISMLTPSGRFEIGKEICLSNSSYHPESWSPMWGVDTIILGLISFFFSSQSTTGSLKTSVQERTQLAKSSRTYNTTTLGQIYRSHFPEEYAADEAYLAAERENAKKEDAEKKKVSNDMTINVMEKGSTDIDAAVEGLATGDAVKIHNHCKHNVKEKKDASVGLVIGVIVLLVAFSYAYLN